MPSTRSHALRLMAAATLVPAALAGSRNAQAATPTIRVVTLPVDGSKALYYGVQAGIFRKYGVTVEPRLMNSGPLAVAALIGGSADIASSNIASILQANERGIPLKIIAASGWFISTDKPHTVLLTAKDGAVRTAADLNGKTVGTVSLGGIFLVGIRAWIDQNGGDSHTVSFIELPAASIDAALDQGRVVAAASNEPGASQSLATGRFRVLGSPMESIGKRYQSAAYAVMEPAVAKDPDTYHRFAQGMHEAQVYTNSHDAETVPIVAAYTGVPASVVAQSIRTYDPEYVETQNIQPVIDAMAKYGELKHAFPAAQIISSSALKPPRRR